MNRIQTTPPPPGTYIHTHPGQKAHTGKKPQGEQKTTGGEGSEAVRGK